MKKMIIIGALLSSTLAYAGVDITGQGRVRHTVTNNKDFSFATGDRTASTGMRFQMNVKGTKSDSSKFYVFMQPQFSYVQGTDTNGDSTGKYYSGQLRNPSLNMHQAYFNYNGGDYLNLTVGRFEVNFGDQLVVGAVDWHDEARAFDGLTWLIKSFAGATETLFALKMEENASSEDVDVYGIYHSQSIGELIKEFDLYWINKKEGTAGSVTDFNTFGLRLKDKLGSLDYRFEGTSQNGKVSGTKTQGNQIDLELGYTLPFMSSRLALEYFKASEKYNQLYPTAHKWLGFADLFMRKNISGIVVHYSMKPSDDLVVKVDYHMFSRTKDSVTAYNFSGGAYGTTGTNKSIANELDLTLNYTLDKGLSTQLGYSLVTVGDYLKNNNKGDSASYSYLQFVANF